MTPQYSDWYRNRQLMKSWRKEKALWLALQGTVLFVIMTLLVLVTALNPTP